ncbi:MAG TPA: TIGR01777 family oxidoreductase [Tepidisphaeraceae bacterium]|jgi:hypothetical protein
MSGNRRIILAGGSGFIGRALADDLVPAGYELVVLTRRADRPGPIRYVHWDGRTIGEWARELDGALAVVNLAGRNVNCRYTAEHRREIQSSRVDAVRAVGEAIARCATPPKVLIQSSTTAIYGDAGDRWCDEFTPSGQGFSPETATLWERTFHETPTPHARRVLLRIAFVLGRGGGALGTLERLTRWFLGGRAGTGRQWISWLHVHDLCRAVRFAIEREDVSGLYNVCTPQPVTNAEFMRELRRVLHWPWSPPAPVWAVRLGAWVMRSEAELALWGRRCSSQRLLETGFELRFPDLRGALDDLYVDSVVRKDALL